MDPLEDFKPAWRDEARALAIQDAKNAGMDFTSDSVRPFLAERESFHYATFERIGRENIA
jgi:hypothetical protein